MSSSITCQVPPQHALKNQDKDFCPLVKSIGIQWGHQMFSFKPHVFPKSEALSCSPYHRCSGTLSGSQYDRVGARPRTGRVCSGSPAVCVFPFDLVLQVHACQGGRRFRSSGSSSRPRGLLPSCLYLVHFKIKTLYGQLF